MPHEASGATTPQTKEFVGPPAPPTLEKVLDEFSEENADQLRLLSQVDRTHRDYISQLRTELKSQVDTLSAVDGRVVSVLSRTSDTISTLTTLVGVLLFANLVLALAVIGLYRRLKKYGWR